MDDNDDDSSDEDDDMHAVSLYLVLEAKRYIAPRNRVERPPSRIDFYLTRMNEKEFKFHFRMSRPYFLAVCQLIAGHSEFKCVPGKQQKLSVELHLMALLKTLGSMDGQGHSTDFLSVGGNTPESLLAKRVVRALLRFKAQTICWPCAEERREISTRIQTVSSFPHSIGLIDGTLFPLLYRPQDHGEDYYSRKASYAINALVICDDRCRIRYENIGWPGSSHDNRVWRNSKLALQKTKYFDGNEYILGDSAYQPSSVLIPSYETSCGGQLSLKEGFFNTRLAKIRIRVEHYIGMLKGRFPILKSLRARLRNKKEMKDTISFIRAGMILHNIAINDPIPEEWIHRGEDEDQEEEDDLPGRNCASEERRSYLRDYVYDSNF